MRIGLSGAQGVGKTTLAGVLSVETGLPLVEEQARVVAGELGLDHLRKLKGRPQLSRSFQWQCLKAQIRAEEELGRFIADRTVIDNAAYWLKWRSGRSTSRANVNYYRECERHAKTYDLMLYVPPEIPLVSNGFRTADTDYQAEMDWLIRTVLRGLVPAEKIFTLRGSLKERLDLAGARIRELEKEGSRRRPGPSTGLPGEIYGSNGVDNRPDLC